MTWISLEQALERVRVKRSRFLAILSSPDNTIETLNAGKSANGKFRRLIRPESIPKELLKKGLDPSTSPAGRSQGAKKDGTPHLADGAVDLERPNGNGPDAIQSRPPVSSPSAASTIFRASEEALAEANRIADWVQRIDGAQNKTAAVETAARELNVTTRTVQNYRRACHAEGLNGLLPKPRTGGPRALSSEWVEIAAAIFAKLQTPNFAKVYRELVKECILRGVEPPSKSWAPRSIKRTLSPATIALKRSVKKYREDWRVNYEPCVLREKHDTIRDICDGDWHRVDLFVIDDEGVNSGKPYRPFLCAIGDTCSDEIFGLHLQRHNSAIGVGLALRHAILPKRNPTTHELDDKVPQACAGRFNEFYTDRGRDFISEYIKTVMHEFGGSTREAEGFHGQSKPIERWFKTLTENLISELPGHCGRSPKHKPHDFKPTLTRRELFAKIYEWTFYEYHRRETRALRGLSPYGVLTAYVEKGFKPVIPDEKVMDFLLMPGRIVTVRKWGIEMFGTPDRRNIYMDDVLAARQLIGEKVLAKYDPDDLGTLYVYHKNQFIGAVHQERRRGYRETDLRDLYRRRKLAKRAADDRIKELMAKAQYRDDLERVKAERVYGEMQAQELREVAAGASSGSIRALMPKHARAIKRLELIKSEAAKLPAQDSRGEANPYLADEELPSVFTKPEKNPWLEEDDQPLTREQMFSRRKREAWEDDDELPTREGLFKPDDCDRRDLLGEYSCAECGKESIVAGDTSFCFACSKNLCAECFNSPNHQCDR